MGVELERAAGILASSNPTPFPPLDRRSSLSSIARRAWHPRQPLAFALAVLLACTPVAPPPLLGNAQAQALPDLGDSSQVALTPAQERKIGEAVVRQIRAAGGYLNDPEVNDYLNELGYRLVNASTDAKQDFEFFTVPDSQMNAFALPGGLHRHPYRAHRARAERVGTRQRGRARISHVTQRHIARIVDNQKKNTMLLQIAGLRLAVLAAQAGGGGGGQGVQAAIGGSQALAAQQQINFTRDNEYEADRIGFSRLSPRARLPTASPRSSSACSAPIVTSSGNAPSYLRTHPITYERIAEAQSRSQGRPYKQVPDCSISIWCARCSRATRATRASKWCRSTSPYASRGTTTRSPSATGTVAAWSATGRRAREAGTREARKDRAGPPDDRGDGRQRADGRRRVSRRRGAVRDRAAALSEQEAARLRLPRSAHQGEPAGEGVRFRRARTPALPGRRAAPPDRRARVRRAEHAPEAAPAPGRVLRVGRQPAPRDRSARTRRPRPATATSTRCPSSRRACARCAPKCSRCSRPASAGPG